jgi:PTS hybrid protein
MTDRVGLVIVSHSPKIAEGIVDVAAQMAPNVVLRPAGGTDDDGIGTSFEKVAAAIADADGGAGVVILGDLGSAILTAETALDFLDDDQRERVRIADAPIVEGAVAAAVSAEGGAPLAEVLAAGESARGIAAPATPGEAGATPSPGAYARSVTLINPDGLHARPAAEFVKLAGTFPVAVTVNGTNAKSLLAIMAMGLRTGSTVEIAGTDTPEGREAVDALAELTASGFGEV